jgi:hypothetical protein
MPQNFVPDLLRRPLINSSISGKELVSYRRRKALLEVFELLLGERDIGNQEPAYLCTERYKSAFHDSPEDIPHLSQPFIKLVLNP